MFCPKCGKELEERKAGFRFEFGNYQITVYGCNSCKKASVTGADELEMRTAVSPVNQTIGTVGPGANVTGLVIGSIG